MAPTVAPVRKFAAVRFVRADDGSNYAPVYLLGDDGDACLSPILSTPFKDEKLDQRSNEVGRFSSPFNFRGRSPNHQRDSLKNRYSPGRPGSRRHQRWMNEIEMRQQLEEVDLKELYSVEWKSSFSELFEGNNMEKWEEFCRNPEDTQKLFERPKQRAKTCKQTEDAGSRFSKLDRRAKGILKKGVGHEFVESFESALLQMMNVPDEPPNRESEMKLTRTARGAIVRIDDAMDRLLAHAVCNFHMVDSYSASVRAQLSDPSQGGPGTLVQMCWPQPPSPMPPPPTCTLTEHLTAQRLIEAAA